LGLLKITKFKWDTVPVIGQLCVNAFLPIIAIAMQKTVEEPRPFLVLSAVRGICTGHLNNEILMAVRTKSLSWIATKV